MQGIKIYNASSGKKEVFQTLQPGVVKIYVCGITVYDYCHVGHARCMVFFDVLARFLRHAGYTVNYVRNITDVDDKIIARAIADEIEISELTDKFIKEMHNDEANLGNLSPDYEPKASDNISEMIELIQKLIAKGHAYSNPDGSVWFDVRSYKNYGSVSGQDIDSLDENVRKDMDKGKKDPLDFALWKPVLDNEPFWESPWGRGRPGWHIECSAMASNYLGFTIDIHGGGIDLKFPHHENESAQSCCAFDADFVRNWMHVGHVTDKSEKMSKSLGNFVTIKQALKVAKGEAIRYLLLASHYRKPLPFDIEQLKQAEKVISRFYRVMQYYPPSEVNIECAHVKSFMAAMRDDFNIVKAFAECFEMVKAAYNSESKEQSCIYTANLRYVLQMLGFAVEQPDKFLKGATNLSESQILELISKRDLARESKNWAEADKLRDELLLEGVMLEDGADGTKWRTN